MKVETVFFGHLWCFSFQWRQSIYLSCENVSTRRPDFLLLFSFQWRCWRHWPQMAASLWRQSIYLTCENCCATKYLAGNALDFCRPVDTHDLTTTPLRSPNNKAWFAICGYFLKQLMILRRIKLMMTNERWFLVCALRTGILGMPLGDTILLPEDGSMILILV